MLMTFNPGTPIYSINDGTKYIAGVSTILGGVKLFQGKICIGDFQAASFTDVNLFTAKISDQIFIPGEAVQLAENGFVWYVLSSDENITICVANSMHKLLKSRSFPTSSLSLAT